MRTRFLDMVAALLLVSRRREGPGGGDAGGAGRTPARPSADRRRRHGRPCTVRRPASTTKSTSASAARASTTGPTRRGSSGTRTCGTARRSTGSASRKNDRQLPARRPGRPRRLQRSAVSTASYNNYGKLKASFEWNQIPLNFSDTTRTLYTQSSPGVLSISDGIQSGIQNKALTLAKRRGRRRADVRSAAQRDIADFRLTYSATPTLDLKSYVKNTQRNGAAAVVRPGSGSATRRTSSPLPLDQRTTDFGAALEWANGRGLAQGRVRRVVLPQQHPDADLGQPAAADRFGDGRAGQGRDGALARHRLEHRQLRRRARRSCRGAATRPRICRSAT